MTANALVRWIVGKALGLPPRLPGELASEALSVPMRDGVMLAADRYWLPRAPGRPTVLIRSAYGRDTLFGLMAALIAERGFNVLIQSIRGTAGSGGVLDPMRQEQADGADTLDWMAEQPWFTGKTYTFGGSYLGNAQWAMAAAAPERLDAMAVSVAPSNFRDELLGFGGFTQAGTLLWTNTMLALMDGKGLRAARPDFAPVHTHLPVGTLDEAAFGKPVSWWRDWTTHDDPADPWWRDFDYSQAVAKVVAPVSMTAGWQDIFLPFQLKDFMARQAAGRPTWITIGPWYHASRGAILGGLSDAITFFTALAKGGEPHAGPAPVKAFIQEANEWREYPTWPPPGAREMRLHLRSGFRLDPNAPEGDEGAAAYTYDPADPTPSLHGPLVMGGDKRRNVNALAARTDVLRFSGEPLDADLEVIGPVSVELTLRSDRPHTDVFACLCDADAKGGIRQVCDGYLRLPPGDGESLPDGARRIIVECWPTAWRFRRGHRLALLIASGAFPRFARNLGTGEPLATATKMVAAHQEVLLGADAGSTLVLSVVG
jgi:putative CocE/NonD family hydrolase